MSAPVHWTQVQPRHARDLMLPDPDVIGPISDQGEPCPWPWDPQQLAGAPLGQYHCPYCGSMVVAGWDHLDYGDDEPVA